MRKYILFTGLLAIALIALTACYDVAGNTGLGDGLYEISTTNTFDDPVFDDYGYLVNAHDEAVHNTSWQEAYTEILDNYAQQPATTADIEAAEWRFMLHDINQNGIPQLFLVRYYDGLVNFHTVYSFVYGDAIMLKSALSMSHLFRGGMYVAPGGTGVVRYITSGAVSHYDRYGLYGGTLSRSVNGDTSPSVDSFRVNAFPVTQEEFVETFGCSDGRTWLVMYEISEGNIRDVIFGW